MLRWWLIPAFVFLLISQNILRWPPFDQPDTPLAKLAAGVLFCLCLIPSIKGAYYAALRQWERAKEARHVRNVRAEAGRTLARLQGEEAARVRLKKEADEKLIREAQEFARSFLDNIPQETREGGTWVIAPSRRGKTNLLHCLIEKDRKRKGTIIIIDSKGELLAPYKTVPGAIVIDPATAHINPLHLGSSTRTMDFLEYIFSALLETSMTQKQKTLFRSVLAVLIKHPDATLETFRQFLTRGWKPFEDTIRQCDEGTQDFFFIKNAGFDSNTYSATKEEILWRLKLILDNEHMRKVFTSTTTNVPFAEHMDSGKLILIDNSIADLGEDGAEFFGRFFIALIWLAAVDRSKRAEKTDKLPVYVYIDECHTVIHRDEKIVTILDECGSQSINLLCAHQRIAQVEPGVLNALANCAIRIANSDDDAAALAPRFRVTPDILRQPRGNFVFYVRDMTPMAVVIPIPKFDLNNLPKAAPAAPPAQRPAPAPTVTASPIVINPRPAKKRGW
jgi:hypothetical protein